LARGDIRRLAIFMPPGAAKSTYASILFPAWFLARYPQSNILAASHTVELAERFGRKVRNLISEHSLELGVQLAEHSQAAGRWETSAGGDYFAAGVGLGIAGFRADLAVIDDPIRKREEADSELIRDKIWDWYISDLVPRLKPGARLCLIQTRWHEDDLAGHILGEMASGGRQWEVISLPAVAEGNDPLGRKPGDLLWPEWFNDDMLIEAKRDARTWSALYQQRPAPEDGDYFRAAWLKPYDKPPARETLRVYGGSDYAVTADGGDYTCHVVVGLDPEGRMYLLDLWRKQASSDEWIEAFCDLVKEWKPVGWAEEQGQIKSGVGPYLDRRQQEREAYVYRQSFPTRGDKAVRAQSIRGRMGHPACGLYVPIHAQWYPGLRSELLSFPAGKHDDQVDALGLVGQLLDIMSPGNKPADPVQDKNPSGYRTHTDFERLEALDIL
jgi:predicted phage terminase large subunit-like protein